MPLREAARQGKASFIDGDWIEAPYITNEGIRLIQTGNIGTGAFIDKADTAKYISASSFRMLRCKWVRANHLLICRLADPIGRACEVPAALDKSVTSVDVTIVTPDTDKFDRRYLLHALNSDASLRAAADSAGGSTRARISRSNLGKLPITLPPLGEQSAIARILDTLDTQIEKTRALIAKLEQVKEGLLHDLLTRGVDENGELRPSAEEAPELYKASALGLIPREWATEEIGAIATKIQDGTHFSPTLGGHDFMYVTSKNIRFGHLDLTDVDWIDQRQHAEIFKRCDVRFGDLLLTKDGANTGNAALNTCPDPISLLSSVAFIRFSPQTDDAEFFLQQILSRNAQQRILDAMSGNAITRLTLEKIRAFRVRRPPVTEQRRISAAVKAKTQIIGSLNSELKQALKLKSGLMDDLLTGRVRVTPLLDPQQPPATV